MVSDTFVQSTESPLLIPKAYQRRNVQMSKAIVFWFNKELDHIMVGHPTACPAAGYQKIECIHAHEVEKWSKKLTDQQERMKQYDDEEWYQFEDKIMLQQRAELVRNLEASHDETNRLFIKAAIDHIDKRREEKRPKHIKREAYMAVEAEEGLAP